MQSPFLSNIVETLASEIKIESFNLPRETKLSKLSKIDDWEKIINREKIENRDKMDKTENWDKIMDKLGQNW